MHGCRGAMWSDTHLELSKTQHARAILVDMNRQLVSDIPSKLISASQHANAAIEGEWVVRSWRWGATDSFVIDLHIQGAKQLTLSTLLVSFRLNPSEFHIIPIDKQASLPGTFPRSTHFPSLAKDGRPC